MKKSIKNVVVLFLVLLCAGPQLAISQEPNTGPVFKPEELDQLLAPIALYPDSLLSQMLMASTYPLEVVHAQRWLEQNKDLSGDALAKALENKSWDPSVKSLVNFPQVLAMMNEKLDWTQKLGDAFLAQQKDVMDTIQKLRSKAQEAGNLNTTKELAVKAEPNVIVLESADPCVIYVPTYNTTVVYGTWPYSAYPPYNYNSPGCDPDHHGINMWYCGAGVGYGAAWGYAWGHTDWHGGDIDIDFDRNLQVNPLIDRGKYAQQWKENGQLGQNWQHNPADRRGVPYRDQATAQRFNRASTADAVSSREAYRGRAEQGRQDLAGGADRMQNRPQATPATRGTPGTRDISSRDVTRPAAGTRPATGSGTRSPNYYSQGSAMQGMDQGSYARNYSSRGQTSRQSSSYSRPSGGQGGYRGGGGGGSRGGSGGRGGGGGGRR